MDTTSTILLNKRYFVSRHTTFLENEFIQEGGSGRNIEFIKVHDLQIDPEISVVGPQEDSQSKVPKDDVHVGKCVSKSQSSSC